MKTNIYLSIISGLLLLIVFDINAFATKHRIATSDFVFTPKTLLNVKLGDTIRWFWVTGLHTTTSDTLPTGAATWNKPIDDADTVYEYVPAVLGIYKYHCTPHISFGMLASFTVVPPSGISDQGPQTVFTFFPDPVISNLTIHLESTDRYIRDIKIFDPAGKLIREITHLSASAGEDKTINLSDLPAGIFLVEIIDNQNYHFSRKVTKL